MKPYNKTFEGTEISKANILQLTGYTFEQWCEFSGLFEPGIYKGFINYDDFSLKGKYPNFRIKARNKNVLIRLEFHIRTGIIYAYEFSLKQVKKGVGKIAFAKHIELATTAGFKKIRCWAYGGTTDKSNNYNGHITWAKFGFLMTPKSHREFVANKKAERKEETLYKLLNAEGGPEYWQKNGHAWRGFFDLSAKSESRRRWSAYLLS